MLLSAPAMLPLGQLSFRLHKELAEKHDGHSRWGYSGSTGLSLSLTTDDQDAAESAENGADWLLQGTSRSQVAARSTKAEQHQHLPSWLRASVSQTEIISTNSSTAQV